MICGTDSWSGDQDKPKPRVPCTPCGGNRISNSIEPRGHAVFRS